MVQIFPSVDARVMPVVPVKLQCIVTNRDNRRFAIELVGTGGRQRENVFRAIRNAHVFMTAATFDAWAGFAEVAQGVMTGTT